MTLSARTLVGGEGRGPVLYCDEPLSFWGGVDPADGRIVDRHHPRFGESVTGTVVVMERSRGSSSASSVLAEMIRIGSAPAGLILAQPDPIVVLGAMVARELYGTSLPVVTLPVDVLRTLEGASVVSIHADGVVIVRPTSPD